MKWPPNLGPVDELDPEPFHCNRRPDAEKRVALAIGNDRYAYLPAHRVRLSALPAVESAVRNLAHGSKCLDDKSYIAFFVQERQFLPHALRLYRGGQCRSYDWVREALFGPPQRRQSRQQGQCQRVLREDDG